MADGEAVIRLDADVSAYINKVVRAQKETKEAGKGVQESAAKWLETNLKGVGALTAALKVVEAMATTAKTYADNMARASEAGGKQALNEANILAKMGKGAGVGRALLSDETANATRDQKLAFLSQLANLQEQRREKYLPQLKPQEVQAMAGMFAQGGEAAFGAGGADLFKAVEAMPPGVSVGISLKRMLAGRLNLKPGQADGMGLAELQSRYMRQLPAGAMDEMMIQAEEDRERQETQAGAAESGKRARLLKARRARREAEMPWISGAKSLSVFGVGPGPLIEAGESISEGLMTAGGPDLHAGDRSGTLQVLQSIDRSLKQGLRPNLPDLNTRSGADK